MNLDDELPMIKLIAIQHRLPSISWLFSEIERSGICTSATLLSKPYSSIPCTLMPNPPFLTEADSIQQAFAFGVADSMLLLDEGGSLHNALPAHLESISAGVEQTTFGLNAAWKYPTVLVCRSAAKLYFESQIIARGILRKLNNLGLLTKHNTFGVVGLGAIGSEIARRLIAHDIIALGADIKGKAQSDLSLISVPLNELLARCDVILGCTGSNVLEGLDLRSYSGKKIFVSCSSRDVEFRFLLNCLSHFSGYENVQGWLGNLHVTVLNGGYPINFDRQCEWELFEEILLTRKLVFAGLAQAKLMIESKARGIMLDPGKQLKIVNEWLDQVPDRRSLRMPESLDDTFFVRNSEGEIIMSTPHDFSRSINRPNTISKAHALDFNYSVECADLPITISTNVYSPTYNSSTRFYLEYFPDVSGLDFLEIGCGPGFISLFAAHNGAKKVVAVDSCPCAVQQTHQNFERFNIVNAEAFVSDGFSEVKGLFDVISCNSNHQNHIVLRPLLVDISSHLKPSGMVIFNLSEPDDVTLLEIWISKNGFRTLRKLSNWIDGYNCILFFLVQNNILTNKNDISA